MAKKKSKNCLEYGRIHHEVLYDRFDESRNDLKLNNPARYEYQSLHLELLRVILANTPKNHYNILKNGPFSSSSLSGSMKISSRTVCNVNLCHLSSHRFKSYFDSIRTLDLIVLLEFTLLVNFLRNDNSRCCCAKETKTESAHHKRRI